MLINQPSKKPTRKMKSVGISSLGVSLVIGIASYFNFDIDPELAALVVSGLGFVAGYFTREESV